MFELFGDFIQFQDSVGDLSVRRLSDIREITPNIRDKKCTIQFRDTATGISTSHDFEFVVNRMRQFLSK